MKDVLAAVGAFVLVVWGLGLLSYVDAGLDTCPASGDAAIKRASRLPEVSASTFETT